MDEIKLKWKEADHEEALSREVKLIEMLQLQYGKPAVEMLRLFTGLNSDGQTKALNQLEDISEIPKYRKDESE